MVLLGYNQSYGSCVQRSVYARCSGRSCDYGWAVWSLGMMRWNGMDISHAWLVALLSILDSFLDFTSACYCSLYPGHVNVNS